MGNLSQCCHTGLVSAPERSSDGLVSNGIKKQRRMKLSFGQYFRSITGWKDTLGKDASHIKITLKYLYVGIGKP
jgi:hypothetical protein